ncbi:MAG: ComEA family DNA-binding protein [Actinomyces graevenitzii]|jgi:competence protein comEA helix-hairpin-helix repeat region|uniref:ComEA family DNA-binding protein n=1 Tax=Actinomyces graevenitzii TaxID=55565 RepID=A0A9E7AGG0_9ACTO|nr:ComEA family DNA-binding protein [Actinomyces graevenitzii]UQF79121.1 MAG: ComEA family DNA-binding protein [Actinomyces graevenitzii]
MQDFIRVAYSGDHEQVERPYRVAMGAKAALWGGITLIALGLLIAAWQLFITSPEPSRAQTGAKTATTRAQSLGTAKSAAVAASAQASARSPAPASGVGNGGAGPASSGGATSGGDTAGSGQIVVDVDGAVAHPGLYKLPPDSRVQAALAAAGGLSPQADAHRINRAAKLHDGQKLYVLSQGESTPPLAASSGQGCEGQACTSAEGGLSGSDPEGQGLVNINTANAAQLTQLPGVGPAIAQKIIDYRTANGPFTSVDDLTKVPGIGAAKLAQIKSHARV